MTRSNADSPSLLNRAQTWTLDGPGNWTTLATTDSGGTQSTDYRADTSFNEYCYIGSTPPSQPPTVNRTHDDNGNQTYDGTMNMYWDAMNRLTKWTTGGSPTYFWRYIYDAQNRRVAKYYVHYHGEEAMLRDREAKLYCAADAPSAGFSLLADAWTHGEGVNPYVGAAVRESSAPVHESSAGVPPANVRSSRFSGQVRSAGFSLSDNDSTTKDAKDAKTVRAAAVRSGGVLAGGAGQSSGFSLQNDNYPTTEDTEYSETVRGGAQVRSAGFSLSPSEECRGGSDWLDERATEALLERAGVLCDNPTYPVYEKQTFAYDGWRVIQEHKKTAYGTGIPLATAIPVARQFTYGNYLDEALTVDADTDSDGDCIDSGGSTRYYYHQNSLFSVVALSDASANYKEGYQYDPYGRHVRITDGNDGDTYVNFNTNDTRSALATSNYGNPYLFTGQRLDSESGLYYYKNRYYSSSQGRFISRDPIGYGDSTNLYEYVAGVPTDYCDPYGLRRRGRRWDDGDNRDRGWNLSLLDERGKELLGYWLSGDYTDITLDSETWANYMKANSLLRSQLEQQITQDALTRVMSGQVRVKFHAVIEDGYSTGYQMLHGSNAKVGDFQITGWASVTDVGTSSRHIGYSLTYGWHDRINPMYSIDTDRILAWILKRFYSPKDYNVHIIWSESAQVCVQGNGSQAVIVQKYGYPF